jgi:hypothetical protein
MPESKKNDFVWDVSKNNFAIFDDKVFERFIDETVEESHSSGT